MARASFLIFRRGFQNQRHRLMALPRHWVPCHVKTGTAHVQLVPFWAARLGRKSLVCRQASARGGTLWCEWRGDRVRMAGDAVLYAKGEIHLPDGM